MKSLPPFGCDSTMLPGVTVPLNVKKTTSGVLGVPTGVDPRFAAPGCHRTKFPVPGIWPEPFGD